MEKFMEAFKKGFSVVASETKKLTKTVAGKTSNFVDITKLNIALSDTDKKIAEIYEEIGKTVYQKYCDDEPITDDFSELCEAIDEFVSEKETIKAQIAELKKSIPCPECGQNNDKENEFCAKCGAKLKKADDDDDKVIEVIDFEDDE